MRLFILSLSARSQLLIILFGTILIAFISATTVHLLFGSAKLTAHTDLITGIYTILGTIYAVLLAFSVSGVWQNYCASEASVTAEAAALTDLIHTVRMFSQAKAKQMRAIATKYLTEVIAIEWPTIANGHNELIMSPASKTFVLSMDLVREVQAIQPIDARDNVIFSHALTLLTKWLDARRTRIMISKGNIARSLWPLLIAGALILFAFHGLFIFEYRLLWATLLLFFSCIIGLSFYLIFTLDCPFTGSPVVDSGPFKWALTWLNDGDLTV